MYSQLRRWAEKRFDWEKTTNVRTKWLWKYTYMCTCARADNDNKYVWYLCLRATLLTSFSVYRRSRSSAPYGARISESNAFDASLNVWVTTVFHFLELLFYIWRKMDFIYFFQLSIKYLHNQIYTHLWSLVKSFSSEVANWRPLLPLSWLLALSPPLRLQA